jgi:type III restriction enzyme
MILERHSQRWFKPAKGQFQIFYKFGADQPEYQPDFVGEAEEVIYLLESKAEGEMTDNSGSAGVD